jgi:hypothetical protein
MPRHSGTAPFGAAPFGAAPFGAAPFRAFFQGRAIQGRALFRAAPTVQPDCLKFRAGRRPRPTRRCSQYEPHTVFAPESPVR